MNDPRRLISDTTITCIYCQDQLMGPLGIIDSLKERSESKMLILCDKCWKTFHLHKFFDEHWKIERFFVDFAEADNKPPPVTCYLCGLDVAACLIAEKCDPIEIPLLEWSKKGRWRIPKKIEEAIRVTRRLALQLRDFVDPGANAPVRRKP